MARRGAAKGGDNGVVVRVWMVWVVHCWVVAIVLWRSFGDADFRFTHVPRTRGLKPACVILLRDAAGPVVVTTALVAAYQRGVSRSLGKSDLPLVAHLGGLGVAQNFRALQGTVCH